MWFIRVEVQQETSAPLPKKNPGSAPENQLQKIFSTLNKLRIKLKIRLSDLRNAIYQGEETKL